MSLDRASRMFICMTGGVSQKLNVKELDRLHHFMEVDRCVPVPGPFHMLTIQTHLVRSSGLGRRNVSYYSSICDDLCPDEVIVSQFRRVGFVFVSKSKKAWENESERASRHGNRGKC